MTTKLKVLDFAPHSPTMSFCKCGTHAFLVEHLEDEGLLSIAMWQQGNDSFSVFSRLRSIWRIIRQGHPFADQITLDKPGLGDLIKQLTAVYRKLPVA